MLLAPLRDMIPAAVRMRAFAISPLPMYGVEMRIEQNIDLSFQKINDQHNEVPTLQVGYYANVAATPGVLQNGGAGAELCP